MSSKEEDKQLKPENYKTEKDFTTATDQLLEDIRDIKTDWKKRMEALDTIRRTIVGNASAKYPNEFDSFMLKCVVPIGIQVLDLRSAIAKEACGTIETMAVELKNSFEQAAERYLSANCLLKLVLSGNKLLADSGHKAILVVLQNVISPKLLSRITDEMKSKNSMLRYKCGQYLHCILQHYPTSILEKHTGAIEELIRTAVNDASADTRSTGRDCYFLYSELFSGKATALFAKFGPPVQRAILDAKASGPAASRSTKASAHKPTPAKRPGTRAKPPKDGLLSDDVPKAMYNSWKENTDSAKDNNPKARTTAAGTMTKPGMRSASSRRQGGVGTGKESAQTVPVILKQVKIPADSPRISDGEEDERNNAEREELKGSNEHESGTVAPRGRELDQSGYEEQKGEEMASSIDEEEIGDKAPVVDLDSPPKLPVSELIHNATLEHEAIKELGKILQNDDRVLASDEFREVAEVLIGAVTDNHYKVAYDALEAIGNAIVIYTKNMLNYAEQLAPKILLSMSDKRESVTNKSNFVFQLMHTNYGPDKLMPAFIKCLEPSNMMRIKAGALEVMNMLIKESVSYFALDPNVRLCAQKAVLLINDNFKNKKITLPALGVLLALRDKNYEVTVSTILSTSDAQLSKIKTLAHAYAKDLEENIDSFHVAPRDSLPRSQPASKLNSTSKKTKAERQAEEKEEEEEEKERQTVEESPPIGSGKKARKNLLAPEKEPEEPIGSLPKKHIVIPPQAKKGREGSLERRQVPKVAQSLSGVIPLCPSEEEPRGKPPSRISVKATKVFHKKSASPPPRAAAASPATGTQAHHATLSLEKINPDLQLVSKLLVNEKSPSPEDVERMLKVLPKAATVPSRAFWKKNMGRVVSFLFNAAIFVQDDRFHQTGFEILKALGKAQHEAIVAILGNVIENIGKCYIFPKKVWGQVDSVCDVFIQKFGALHIISILTELIPNKSPPILQATIRALMNVVKAGSLEELGAIVESIVKPLFIAINHENADVRKEVVFCLVELYAIIGTLFDKYLTQLSASQIKLIKIYLSKKSQKA